MNERASQPQTKEAGASLRISSGDVPRYSVYVWQWPVRITHWAIVISIGVLTVTGLYIANPFIGTTGPASNQYLMGTMRFVHFLTAFVFTISVLFRIYWAFAGNKYARWNQFIPVQAARLRGLGRMLKFYLFIKREPPATIGHNALAGLTYTVIYLLFLVQIITGFALYSIPFLGGFWPAAFGWVFLLFDIPTVRVIHDVVMWLFLAFVIHHVYSAILVDIEEGSGVLSSIFSGYKSLTSRQLAEVRADEAATAKPAQAGKAGQEHA
jgi:Ni/Fe-hydrogenase 1 B-type cytochrome subunit